MEDIACILGGSLLILAGAALSKLRPPNWLDGGEMLEGAQRSIARWSAVQRIVRKLNNGLLAIVGGIIVATAFIPHGRTWMLAWCVILALVMLCIFFAMIDAFSSLASYRNALPEAARRSFGEQSEPNT